MDKKLNFNELFLKIKDLSNEDLIYLKNKKNLNFDLNKLMNLEKEKLGFKKNNLVFISAGDISKFYWCKIQTFYSLKFNELNKFKGYLLDKIEYSLELNKIKKIPKTEMELLKIGDDLNLKDINQLLKLKKYKNSYSKKRKDFAIEKLNLNISQQEKGEFYEIIYGKKIPKIHFYKQYNNFILTCEPDGICENFIYEFKSSKNVYFSKINLKKARLQADFYCICFEKDNKLIENYIVSENKIKKYEETLNLNEVNKVIFEIKEIISGKLPKKPKEKFKCYNCNFKNICEIKNQ